jgi:NADH dehydrogenase
MFEKMSRWSPALPVLGGGALFQPIAVEQVARAFVRALSRPETIGKTFELGGLERLTMRGILRTVLDVTGRTRVLTPIPMAVGEAQAFALQLLFGKILNKPSPLNRDQLLMLREGNVGETKAADETFGLKHQSLRDGLSRWLGKSTAAN